MSPVRRTRPYRRPRLTRYGRIQAVTTGNSGPYDDGMGGMPSKKEVGPKTMTAMAGPLGGV